MSATLQTDYDPFLLITVPLLSKINTVEETDSRVGPLRFGRSVGGPESSVKKSVTTTRDTTVSF